MPEESKHRQFPGITALLKPLCRTGLLQLALNGTTPLSCTCTSSIEEDERASTNDELLTKGKFNGVHHLKRFVPIKKMIAGKANTRTHFLGERSFDKTNLSLHVSKLLYIHLPDGAAHPILFFPSAGMRCRHAGVS